MKEQSKEENEIVETTTPWPKPVDGLDLADEINSQLNRHIVLPRHASTAITLWIMGTFCMDAWRVWPKLLINSPQKRCGKSTLLEMLESLVNRAMLTSNITASALFRSIEMWSPSLLIDEADTFCADNDELNGIINCGHTKRTARVIRTEKNDGKFHPRAFKVWCPQVIAGIGKQRDTLEDRSIIIEMQRKTEMDSVLKLPLDIFDHMSIMRQMLVKWGQDNHSQLLSTNPTLPPANNDRAVDNWQPLFAIAETIKADWPDNVRLAFNFLNNHEIDDPGTLLLSDIREIFTEVSTIHSQELVDKLCSLEDRPWCEWKRGFPLTANTISKLLKPYKIKPKQIKILGKNRNGYERTQFEDTFNRYLPSLSSTQNSTTLQGSSHKDFSGSDYSFHPPTVELQNSTDGREVEFHTFEVEPLKQPTSPPDASCREVELQKDGNNDHPDKNNKYSEIL